MSKLKVTTISDPDNDNTAITVDTSGNVTFAQNATFSGTVTGIESLPDAIDVNASAPADSLNIDASGNVTLSEGFVPSTQLSHRNILSNGAMQVAQRGTSATGKTASGVYTVDRMALGMENLGTWTVSQETLTSGNAYNAGFEKAFRIDCTTADASPAADDNIFFQYKLEGQDLNRFKKGTSEAEQYTLQFWVKSNKTGTGQVVLFDDNSRAVGKTYTISSADTWEHKVLTFPADTSGAIDNDNTKGFEIEWALDAGSTFQGGTLPTTWSTSNNNFRSINDFALGDSTDNDWAITGIQLEVGSVATPFEHRSYGEELAKCQRYYQKSWHTNKTTQDGLTIDSGGTDGIGYQYLTVPFHNVMRTQPTMTVYDSSTGTSGYWQGSTSSSSNSSRAVTVFNRATHNFSIWVNIGSNWVVSQTFGHWEADAEL